MASGGICPCSLTPDPCRDQPCCHPVLGPILLASRRPRGRFSLIPKCHGGFSKSRAPSTGLPLGSGRKSSPSSWGGNIFALGDTQRSPEADPLWLEQVGGGGRAASRESSCHSSPRSLLDGTLVRLSEPSSPRGPDFWVHLCLVRFSLLD